METKQLVEEVSATTVQPKGAKATMIFRDIEDDEIKVKNTEGETRVLRPDLYEQLASISDPYDSKKEFVGYVDPVVGVVLVDASTLIDNRPDSGDSKEQDVVNPNEDCVDNYESLDSVDVHSTLASTSGEASKPKSPAPESPKKFKTMHQLAYEKKNDGKPLPDDDTRPLSGFGIKKGKLLFNSSTFNAFQDGYHTEERGMWDFEMNSLQKLLDKLNESEPKVKVCVLI